MSSDARGSGFVHLNTPSSIQYTAGQTLTLSDVTRKRTRVECVTLPSTQSTWRKAFALYKKTEGYTDFAADAEAERAGEGPVLPPIDPIRPALLNETFLTSTVAASSAATATNASPSAAAGTSGISIMSHHKISGVQQFVYPDHDGVLSTGVVPLVVVSADEKAEQEAAKRFYVSTLTMTAEELGAYEELQMLWKSRARSHSVLGAQHRAAVGGTLAPGQDENDASAFRSNTMTRGNNNTTNNNSTAVDNILDGDMAGDAPETAEDLLAEALRMADDLLRLA